MKSVSLSSPRHLAGTVKPTALDGLARRLVLRPLGRVERGELWLRDGDEAYRFGASRNGGTVMGTTLIRK